MSNYIYLGESVEITDSDSDFVYCGEKKINRRDFDAFASPAEVSELSHFSVLTYLAEKEGNHLSTQFPRIIDVMKTFDIWELTAKVYSVSWDLYFKGELDISNSDGSDIHECLTSLQGAMELEKISIAKNLIDPTKRSSEVDVPPSKFVILNDGIYVDPVVLTDDSDNGEPLDFDKLKGALSGELLKTEEPLYNNSLFGLDGWVRVIEY